MSGAGFYERIAEDRAVLDAFLTEHPGLAVDLPERTVEEHKQAQIAEAAETWRYRPPVSTHLIDNLVRGLPVLMLGPGPLGRGARRTLRLALYAVAASGWLTFVVAFGVLRVLVAYIGLAIVLMLARRFAEAR